MRKYLVMLLLAVGLGIPTLPPPSFAQGIELDAILSGLLSKDPSERRQARERLEQFLAALDAERRKAEISDLVARMQEGDYRVQLGAAMALSQLREPWESLNQNADTQRIYDLMRGSKDPTSRGYLDDALANARGLYFDAIRDYNNIDENDRTALDKIGETRAKLLRMANFVESSYAENAQFYLGQYFARLASAFGPGDPSLRSRFIKESNKWFDAYVEETEKGAFRTRNFLYDGYFYRALNEIIMERPDEAIRRLSSIDASGDNRIYVYQFFYSREKGSVVDRFIEAKPLIEVVRPFIEKFGAKLPGNQQALVAAVYQVKG